MKENGGLSLYFSVIWSHMLTDHNNQLTHIQKACSSSSSLESCKIWSFFSDRWKVVKRTCLTHILNQTAENHPTATVSRLTPRISVANSAEAQTWNMITICCVAEECCLENKLWCHMVLPCVKNVFIYHFILFKMFEHHMYWLIWII